MRRLPTAPTTLPVVFMMLLALASCSQATNDSEAGQVAVHSFAANAESGPLIGMIVEDAPTQDHELIILAQPTAPAKLNPGEGIGMYFKAAVVVFEQWGAPHRPPSRPDLVSAINAPSRGAATREVVWLTWRGTQRQDTPTQYEIQASLEHAVTEGFRLHPECYVIDTLEFAAALTDENLTPVAAWKVGPNYATFEDMDPSRVKCEASVTAGLYEDEF